MPVKYYVDVREYEQGLHGSSYVDSLDYDKNFKETITDNYQIARTIWEDFNVLPYLYGNKRINEKDGIALCLVGFDESTSSEEVLEVREYNYKGWKYYDGKWYEEHSFVEGIPFREETKAYWIDDEKEIIFTLGYDLLHDYLKSSGFEWDEGVCKCEEIAKDFLHSKQYFNNNLNTREALEKYLKNRGLL